MIARKKAIIVGAALVSLLFINTAIAELGFMKGKFNPFPFFDLKEEYGVLISKRTYLRMVIWQFRWILVLWLVTQITEDRIIKSIFTALWLFFTFNLIEFFLNYNQADWFWRIGLLLFLIPAIVFYDILKPKE